MSERCCWCEARDAVGFLDAKEIGFVGIDNLPLCKTCFESVCSLIAELAANSEGRASLPATPAGFDQNGIEHWDRHPEQALGVLRALNSPGITAERLAKIQELRARFQNKLNERN